MQLTTPGALGAAVRAARTAAHLSQGETASRAGMSRVALARLEAGTANPTWDTVLRVTSVLGMQLEVTWMPGEVPAHATLPARRRRSEAGTSSKKPGARAANKVLTAPAKSSVAVKKAAAAADPQHKRVPEAPQKPVDLSAVLWRTTRR